MAFFDLTEPVYTNRSLNCTAQDTDPSGFCVTEDGLLLFMAGRTSDTIYKYDLSEAHNPGSGSYSGQSYDVGPLFDNPSFDQLCGIRCNADASWIVVSILDVDGTSAQWPNYKSLLMSTPGDLSTISSEGTGGATIIIGTSTAPNEITFGFDMTADGLQFVQVSNNDELQTFDSDTAFVPRDAISNEDTGADALKSTDRSDGAGPLATMTEVHNVKWDRTGNNLFYCGNDGVHKVHANLSTRLWAIALPIDHNANVQISPDRWWVSEIDEISTAVYDLWVSDTGSAMMLLGDNGFIYDYALTLASPQFSLSTYTYKRKIPSSTLVNEYEAGSGRTFDYFTGFTFANNGNMIVASFGETGAKFYPTRFDLASPYDLSNPTFHSIVAAFISYMRVPHFNTNGTALIGGSNAPNAGNRSYLLTIPFDLTSLDVGYTVQDDPELSASGSNQSLWFSQDGLIYVCPAAAFSQAFNAYRLTTPYDITTIITGSLRTVNIVTDQTDATTEAVDNMLIAQHLSKVDKWNAGGRFLSIHSNTSLPLISQWLYEGDLDDNWRYEEVILHEDITGDTDNLVVNAQFNPSYTVLTLALDDGSFDEIQFPDLSLAGITKVVVVSPQPRDAGWLVMDTRLQVTLLNQTNVTQEVTILNGPTSSVTITGFGVGTTIVAGGTLGFFVTIPKDILPGLDLTFTATFDNSVFTTVFSFVYQIVSVWGFGHQWNVPIEQVCEWATSLVVAKDKSEQRRQLRTFPKVTQKLSHSALNAERQRLFNTSTFAAEFPTVVPLWMFEHQLTAALSSPDTRIFLDNSDGKFQTGGFIAFYNGIIIDEVSEIADASQSTYIDIEAEGVSLSHVQGKRVYPAGIYSMRNRFNYETITDKVGKLTTVFESLKNNWVNVAADPLIVTYQPPSFSAPAPVFDLVTYRGDLESVSIRTEAFTHDSVASFPLIESRYATSELVEDHVWVISGNAQVKQFLDWMTYIAGRYRSFWFIPERHDLTVTASVLAAATTNAITIQDSLLSRTYDSSKGGLDISIETYELDALDKFYYRSITAITLTGDDESKLSIDTAIHASIELTVANIKKVTIMRYTRFSSDSIPLKWITPSIVEVEVGLLFRTY